MQRVCRPPANREFPLGAPGNADLPIGLAAGIGFVLHIFALWWPGPPAAGPNWVCLYNRLPAIEYRLPLFGFVLRIPLSGEVAPIYEDSPCPDAPVLPSLALFSRSLLRVRCTITPFLQATCPSRCSGQNWLCLAHSVPRPPSPRPRPTRPCREIGFVWRNTPQRRLGWWLPRPAPLGGRCGKLALFGAVVPRRALPATFAPSWPPGPNWVRLARFPRPNAARASSRRGIGFVLHDRPPLGMVD